jgi:hypothetical protein
VSLYEVISREDDRMYTERLKIIVTIIFVSIPGVIVATVVNLFYLIFLLVIATPEDVHDQIDNYIQYAWLKPFKVYKKWWNESERIF